MGWIYSLRVATIKLIDWRTRLYHVLSYCSVFMVLLGLHGRSITDARAWLFIALLGVTHFITDSRRWASGAHWAPKPIIVDQTIHVVTLAFLGRILL